MTPSNPALPEDKAASVSDQPVSEVELLCDQGYRQLQGVATAQTPAQAVAICDQALENFQQALQIANDDLEQRRFVRQSLAAAYSQLGHQQRYANNHAAAIVALSEALKLSQALPDDFYYRARSQLKLGDEPAARADFTEYLRRGEDDYLNSVARQQIAALVFKSGDTKAKAGQFQQEGVRLNAEAASAMQPRGDAPPEPFRAVALYNRALAAFDNALQADSNDMMTRISLISALSQQADCYLQMNEYDLAVENFNRAYAIHPLIKYIFRRGEAYRAGGYIEQARADFARYLKEGNDATLKLQAKQYLEEKPKQASSPEVGA